MNTARLAVIGQLLLCLAGVFDGALVALAALFHDVLVTAFYQRGRIGGALRAGAWAAITSGVSGLALAAGAARARPDHRRPLVIAELVTVALVAVPTQRVLTTPGDGWLLRGLVLAFDALAVLALVALVAGAERPVRHSAWRRA